MIGGEEEGTVGQNVAEFKWECSGLLLEKEIPVMSSSFSYSAPLILGRTSSGPDTHTHIYAHIPHPVINRSSPSPKERVNLIHPKNPSIPSLSHIK